MTDSEHRRSGRTSSSTPPSRRYLALGVAAGTVLALVAGMLLTSKTLERKPALRPDDLEDKVASLVADCSTDVTEELTRIISSASAGATVRLQRDGCYRVDGTIYLTDVEGVTIDGNGATFDGSFEPGARSRRHMRIRGGGDLVIENLRIVGSRCAEPPCPEGGLSEMERQHGIAIENVEGITIRGTRITNVWGDFVYMTQKGEGPQPSEVVIRNNYFKNSGRQGIAGSGVVGLLVEGNWIFDAGRTVFDFEAEGGGARDVTLAGNEIVRPDNATLNVGCADRGTGKPLNEGPIRLVGNRIYQAPLQVNTGCGGQAELSSLLDVVAEGNEDGLEGEPPPFAAS